MQYLQNRYDVVKNVSSPNANRPKKVPNPAAPAVPQIQHSMTRSLFQQTTVGCQYGYFLTSEIAVIRYKFESSTFAQLHENLVVEVRAPVFIPFNQAVHLQCFKATFNLATMVKNSPGLVSDFLGNGFEIGTVTKILKAFAAEYFPFPSRVSVNKFRNYKNININTALRLKDTIKCGRIN